MWPASVPLRCNQLQHVATSCAKVSKIPWIILIWRPASKAVRTGHICRECESAEQRELSQALLSWCCGCLQRGRGGGEGCCPEQMLHGGVSCAQCFMTPWVGPQWCWVSFGCKLLNSDPQAQVVLCSFLCCLFGWAHCSKVYDGKPVEKRASVHPRNLESLCLAKFDVHGSHSPWFPFLCISTGLPTCLVTPSPSLQPVLQAEAKGTFLIPSEPGYSRSHHKDLS